MGGGIYIGNAGARADRVRRTLSHTILSHKYLKVGVLATDLQYICNIKKLLDD